LQAVRGLGIDKEEGNAAAEDKAAQLRVTKLNGEQDVLNVLLPWCARARLDDVRDPHQPIRAHGPNLAEMVSARRAGLHENLAIESAFRTKVSGPLTSR
jgi:hypothetical protein